MKIPLLLYFKIIFEGCGSYDLKSPKLWTNHSMTGRAGLAGAVRGAGHRAVYGALSAVLKPKAPGASWKKGLLA